MKNIILIISTFVLLTNCREQKSPIEGLWVVKSVKVGDKEMTPDGRWMRFNPDLTQESGNGWYQHSFGSYNFDPVNNSLEVKNENGILEEFEPFKVSFQGDEMKWKRKEEDDNVEVSLIKSDKLPSTTGDEILGLWKLEMVVSNDKYFRTSDTTNGQSYFFIRWDKRFVIGLESRRISGLYHVDGHEPVLQLIPYDKHLDRGFWRIAMNEDSLSLTLENADSLVMRKFVRANQFPAR